MEESNIRASINHSFFNSSVGNSKIVFIFVIAIMIAELLLFVGKLEFGILLHILIILFIAISSIWIKKSGVIFSLEVLALLPILRLINISMPIFFPLKMYLYIFIYAPLIIPIFLIIKHQKMTSDEIGIKFNNLFIYAIISLIIGYLIGLGEYNIIKAGTLIPDTSIVNVLKLSIVMFFFVGFIEELIFRSLVQTRLESNFGPVLSLLVTSLLFGMMHSGYGSIYELMFTGFAGLIMGYAFQKTRSFPFIFMIHGFINVFLFGLIPLLGKGLGFF